MKVIIDLLRHWIPIRQRIERNSRWRQSPLDKTSNIWRRSVHNRSLDGEFNIFFLDVLIGYGRDGEWNITRIDGIYVIRHDRNINKLKTIGYRRQWRRARWTWWWWAISTHIGIPAIIGLFPKTVRKFYDKNTEINNNYETKRMAQLTGFNFVYEDHLRTRDIRGGLGGTVLSWWWRS